MAKKFLSDTGLLTLVQNIKESFDEVEERIDDNEYVVAQSLIDLNDRLSDKQDTIDSSHKLSADLISDGSTNKVYTATEKTKLASIASGAEVNVLANWNEFNSSSDAYILNKPTNTNFLSELIMNSINDDDLDNIAYFGYDEDDIISSIELTTYHSAIICADYNSYAGDVGLSIKPDEIEFVNNSLSGNEGHIKYTTDLGTEYLAHVSEVETKSDKIPIINHGTSDTTFTLTPNKYHIWGEVSSLTLTLGSGEAGYLSEYMFEFQSGSTPTTLTLPNTVEWPSTPTIEANKRYLVSIVSNIALIVGV